LILQNTLLTVGKFIECYPKTLQQFEAAKQITKFYESIYTSRSQIHQVYLLYFTYLFFIINEVKIPHKNKEDVLWYKNMLQKFNQLTQMSLEHRFQERLNLSKMEIR